MLILSVTYDLCYFTILPNKNAPLVSDRQNLPGYKLLKKFHRILQLESIFFWNITDVFYVVR